MDSRFTGAWRASLLCLLLGGALWLRVSHAGDVVYEGYAFARTSDAAYHLHRSLLTLEHFPRVPVFDPLMNWPHGAVCHWPPGTDQVWALVPLLLGARHDEKRASRIISVLPVFVALVVVLLTMRMVHAVYAPRPPPFAAVFGAGCIAATLPVFLRLTQAGMPDHHVMESLVVALLCIWICDRFPGEDFAQRSRGRRLAWELSGAAAITASLYLLTVGALYAAPFIAALLCLALFESGRGRGPVDRVLGSGAVACVASAAAVALIYAPSLAVHGRVFAYAFPSLLFPLLLAGVAGAIVVSLAIDAPRPPAPSPLRAAARRAAAAAGFMALVLVGLLSFEEARRSIAESISGFMLGGISSVAEVDEAKPLFHRGVEQPLRLLGWWAPAAFLLLPIGFLEAFRQQRQRAVIVFGGALFTASMALMQLRFLRGFAPYIALGSALGLYALVERLRIRLGSDRVHPGLASALLIAVILLVLGRDPAVASLALPGPDRPMPGSYGASLFLSRHNPVRADGTRAGVLTNWSRGHYLMWPARSGVVANGFVFLLGEEGHNEVKRALVGDESRALGTMDRRDLQWLLTGADYYRIVTVGPRRDRPLVPGRQGRGVVNISFLEQVPLAVAMLGGGGLPARGVAHLGHLAPRWASADHVGNMSFFLPGLFLFEKVKGARLTGTAAPGGRVTARISLEVRGHAMPYRAWADADRAGRYTITVPLSGGASNGIIRTGPYWEVRRPDGTTARVSVTGSQVREGRAVPVGRPGATSPGEGGAASAPRVEGEGK
jgi:asparagine N-glycosylation enzyme membrane subunit Stt3